MNIRNLTALFALGTALLLSPAVSAQTSATAWREFNSAEGRFKVRLPAEPVRSTNTVKVPEGSTHQYLFTAKASGNAYIVTYADYPTGYYLRLGPEKMLDTDRDDFLKTLNARMTSERRYRIGGSPGREFHFTGPDGLTGICSAYLVGFRMYMLCAVTRSGGPLRDMEQFQESFRLVRQPRG